MLVAGLDATDVSNMPFFWHRGADFIKDGTPVKLVYRMATVLDVRDPNAPCKTRELWKASGTQVCRSAWIRCCTSVRVMVGTALDAGFWFLVLCAGTCDVLFWVL